MPASWRAPRHCWHPSAGGDNRELSFPDTREAGIDAGTGIAKDCEADPKGLLYAMVDKHVRRVSEGAAR